MVLSPRRLARPILASMSLVDSMPCLAACSKSVRAIEAAEKEGTPLAGALADFEQAAKQGMESTRDMLAKMGRASRLGKRTIGHQDAGATSCYFILRSLASAVTD
jgi:dihydroxyacetone kinase